MYECNAHSCFGVFKLSEVVTYNVSGVGMYTEVKYDDVSDSTLILLLLLLLHMK